MYSDRLTEQRAICAQAGSRAMTLPSLAQLAVGACVWAVGCTGAAASIRRKVNNKKLNL